MLTIDMSVEFARLSGYRRLERRPTGLVLTQSLGTFTCVFRTGYLISLTIHLLVLDRGVSDDVEAVKDSAFLVTIAWPKGQG